MRTRRITFKVYTCSVQSCGIRRIDREREIITIDQVSKSIREISVGVKEASN